MESYRVVYKQSDNNVQYIDKTLYSYSYNSDDSVEVNLLEYNNGLGIYMSERQKREIYAVLADGTQMLAYSKDGP